MMEHQFATVDGENYACIRCGSKTGNSDCPAGEWVFRILEPQESVYPAWEKTWRQHRTPSLDQVGWDGYTEEET